MLTPNANKVSTFQKTMGFPESDLCAVGKTYAYSAWTRWPKFTGRAPAEPSCLYVLKLQSVCICEGGREKGMVLLDVEKRSTYDPGPNHHARFRRR